MWPAFVLITPIFIAYHINKYVKSCFKQTKIAKILGNEKLLKEYGDSRITKHERKMENLKEKIKASIESHFRKNNQGPLGGTVKIEFLLKYIDLPPAPEQTWAERTWNRLPKDYWKSFVWDDYLSKDFFDISKKARGVDKDICKTLHVFQLKYKTLLRQKNELNNCNETEKLEKTRKIAELSFVKHGIKKQTTKEWLISPLLWALPTGIFWYFLYSSKNDRVLFEKKKEHLQAVSSLKEYEDLVDAHNGLIKNHDYLIPYRKVFNFKDW